MMRVLVAGASGYIGGRLVPVLLARSHDVVCLARDPSKLEQVPWRPEVTVVRGDVSDPDSLRAALEGVDVVYYLVHAMAAGRGFAERDRASARNVVSALSGSPVRRLVYLGGLGDGPEGLSEHLLSRREVGELLLASPVPTTVLRAGIVLGSGSASFEMLRHLTERLPVMVTPRWVTSRTQPVAVRDVLHYLAAAGEDVSGEDLVLDVGGPDVLTYETMMRRYAAVAGLRPRRILPVPLFSPSLSSHWVGVVTPVPALVARPLVGSLRNEAVCTGPTAMDRYEGPPGGLLGFEEAVRLALEAIRSRDVQTRWSDSAWRGAPHQRMPQDPLWSGGTFSDHREVVVPAPVEQVWEVVESIGGEVGWYSMRTAWVLRGVLDHLVGAATFRRGRRDPHLLRVGEAVDAWRVEERDRPHLLRLRAEMSLPGLGWLEWRISPSPDGSGTVLQQRATFAPRGLMGVLYWKSIAPLHGVVFGSMVSGLAKESLRRSGRTAPPAVRAVRL